MTPLRRKRLLLLASTVNGNHKRWYGQYLELMRDGLVGWCFGMAYLTDKGKQVLNEETPR